MRKMMIKRMGVGRGGGIFGSGSGGEKLRYYCMNCGTEHNQLACPKCGSKMKKVGG
jgi:rubrerythrin